MELHVSITALKSLMEALVFRRESSQGAVAPAAIFIA
jgi:hypothetical protein